MTIKDLGVGSPSVARPRRTRSRVHQRTPVLGFLSSLLAIASAVTCFYAITDASSGGWESGTMLGYLAIGSGVLAFVLGVVAIATGRGRGAGIAAVVLSILSNPLLLLYVLGSLERL